MPVQAMGLAICWGIFGVFAGTSSAVAQSIVVLVNDEPISKYDIAIRTKLRLSNSPVLRKKLQKTFKSSRTQNRFRQFMKDNNPRSREEAERLKKRFIKKIRSEVQRSVQGGMKKQVLEALIEERLKLQEAKKLNILVPESDLDQQLAGMAARNKVKKTGKPMSRLQFQKLLSSMGVNIKDFRNRLKAQIAWRQVVRRKYGPLIHVGDHQVDQFISKSGKQKTQKKAVLKLKKIRLAYASGSSQKVRIGRLIEAEALRLRFSGCEKATSLLKTVPSSKIDNIGSKETGSLPQPLRGILLDAKVGELTPPALTSTGVELYAVCGRSMVAGNEKQRAIVKSDLRQKEFTIMARRLLRDVRQDAYIEYK